VKADKVREMSVEELGAKEHEFQEQLFKLRMQKATGQLQNAARLAQVRRDIARVKTILKEKRR
jgi:large subunit ribosomal protein L29